MSEENELMYVPKKISHCSCKWRNCLSKHCICLRQGIICSARCKCVDCQNCTFDSAGNRVLPSLDAPGPVKSTYKKRLSTATINTADPEVKTPKGLAPKKRHSKKARTEDNFDLEIPYVPQIIPELGEEFTESADARLFEDDTLAGIDSSRPLSKTEDLDWDQVEPFLPVMANTVLSGQIVKADDDVSLNYPSILEDLGIKMSTPILDLVPVTGDAQKCITTEENTFVDIATAAKIPDMPLDQASTSSVGTKK